MSLVVVLMEPLGLPVGFPLVPFLNGIVYSLVYNIKSVSLFGKLERFFVFKKLMYFC